MERATLAVAPSHNRERRPLAAFLYVSPMGVRATFTVARERRATANTGATARVAPTAFS